MVLAAGLGTRMRPLTLKTPKPLIKVAGQPLIDHALDKLRAANVRHVVVNAHYLGEQVLKHCQGIDDLDLSVSDEREALLDSGGGVKKALSLLGDDAFFVMNSDTTWLDGPRRNLERMIEFWDNDRMDALLLVASTVTSVGYDGAGDLSLSGDGRVLWRKEKQLAPFVFAGVSLLKPALFDNISKNIFSLKLIFDRAQKNGRLFGLRLDGQFIHVGTPEAIEQANHVLSMV